jgi:hypothetical protein
MSKTFSDRDMSQTQFHSVNLHRAVFEDVNLAEARITNANLANLTIDDANIYGLTIFGFRIDELIEAELARRDPVRASLNMVDPFDPGIVKEVLARLDKVRRSFYDMLQATSFAMLTTRPDPENWSPIEHVRHLLFAEEAYLNHDILGNEEPFSKLGLLPTHLEGVSRLVAVGSEPTDDLIAILAAWDAIHGRLHAFVDSSTRASLERKSHDGLKTVGEVLQGLPLHDLDHMRQVEALLGVTF